MQTTQPTRPPWTPPVPAFLLGPLRALHERQATLTLFGLLMLALLLPTLVATGLDPREWRGVSVWTKPAKFMASLAMFTLTTAWFVGMVSPEARRGRTMRWIVGTIVATGSFEIAYITLQAALGQASHYNFDDRLHALLYSLMGAAALALTATQLLLALLIVRRPRPGLDPAWRLAVVLGLVLTFVLGAGTGIVLGSHQPPAGSGLPLVHWHLSGGDLRPAHFLGLHAQQLVPLAGLAIAAAWRRQARIALVAFAALYTLAWGVAMFIGLDGAQQTLPPASLLT